MHCFSLNECFLSHLTTNQKKKIKIFTLFELKFQCAEVGMHQGTREGWNPTKASYERVLVACLGGHQRGASSGKASVVIKKLLTALCNQIQCLKYDLKACLSGEMTVDFLPSDAVSRSKRKRLGCQHRDLFSGPTVIGELKKK